MAETTSTGKIKQDIDTVGSFNTVKRTLTASAGANSDKWAVPASQAARIKGVRVYNPDASARNIKVEILDASNNVVGALSNTGVDLISVPATSALVVTVPREITLPTGYQLQASWAGMTASGALDWEIMYEDAQS